MGQTQHIICLLGKKVRYDNTSPRLYEFTRSIRLSEVSEYYNSTRVMVGSGNLAYEWPGWVLNNYTLRYGFALTPDSLTAKLR